MCICALTLSPISFHFSSHGRSEAKSERHQILLTLTERSASLMLLKKFFVTTADSKVSSIALGKSGAGAERGTRPI